MQMRLLALVVAALAAGPVLAQLGPLTPPAGPISDTVPDLSQIAQQVSGAAQTRTIVNNVSTPGDASNKFIISQPGSYVLADDIVFGGADAGKNGVLIQADDVTLDLNGYTIRGNGFALAGVIGDNAAPVRSVVRNGNITDTGEWAVLLFGDDCRAERLTVVNTGGGFAAIQVGTQGQVDRCIVRDAAGDGIAVGIHGTVRASTITGATSDGITTSANALVIDSNVAQVDGVGITVSNDALVERCTIRQTGSTGLSMLQGSVARSVRVRFAGQHGATTTGYNKLIDCSFINLTGNGVNLGAYSVVDRCTFQLCSQLAVVPGVSSIIQNSIAENCTSAFVASINTTVRGCTIEKMSVLGIEGLPQSVIENNTIQTTSTKCQ
ncbi:MAG: right-handed parallel beta-helix repeat-containing protein [Pseudomonadota bacterium]